MVGTKGGGVCLRGGSVKGLSQVCTDMQGSGSASCSSEWDVNGVMRTSGCSASQGQGGRTSCWPDILKPAQHHWLCLHLTPWWSDWQRLVNTFFPGSQDLGIVLLYFHAPAVHKAQPWPLLSPAAGSRLKYFLNAICFHWRKLIRKLIIY